MRHLAIYQPLGPSGLNGKIKKFNLASTLSVLPCICPVRAAGWKALTLQTGASIRPPMAAGAILPPMFFERHRLVSMLAPAWHFRRTPLKQHQRDSRPAHSGRPSATSSLPKEI
jgi:hypothetical protein